MTDSDNPRRVLLKLSGEAFGGGKVGIDTQVIRRIAEEIVPAVQQGVQVAIVVGGGNFFRGAELQQAGIDRSRGDYMGMLGTVMNCLALQDFLEQEGQATRVQTAITMGQVAEPYIPLKAIRHLEKGRVVIFGAGAGMPYFSTDTVSIQRSLEIHCDEVLMGKNGVDGVYTADPRKDENAKRFETLSYNRALVDNLAVMGWSQGGRLALLTAARNEVFTSVLTWAGAYDQKGNEAEQYAIAKENGYYEVTYDWREPLKQSPAYYECAMSIDYPAEVAKIKVPLLAINGKADTTVVPETAQKIVDAAVNSPDAEVLLLDGADHTFCVFSNDDTVLKTLVQDTIDWFKKTL